MIARVGRLVPCFASAGSNCLNGMVVKRPRKGGVRLALFVHASFVVLSSSPGFCQTGAVIPERVIVQPDWTAAAAASSRAICDVCDIAGLNDEERLIHESSTRLKLRQLNIQLPVLLPASKEVLNNLRFAGTQFEYSASSDLGGAYVDVVGTRVAFRSVASRISPVEGALRPKKTDTGLALEFTRFNVAYRLEINCESPPADQRCMSDKLILALYNSLRIFGGSAGTSK